MNIVLIGYRGSGKTTLGRKLADKLWLKFIDTDVLISERAGTTIAAIFASRGEAAFRDLESAVITEVAARDGQVIALGGGAILRPENLAALRQNKNARIIYLYATPETLAQRIANDPNTAANRPPLTSAGGATDAAPPAGNLGGRGGMWDRRPADQGGVARVWRKSGRSWPFASRCTAPPRTPRWTSLI